MIGNIIKQKRTKLNMRASTLAKKLEVADIQIYRWENDKSLPALDYLIPLCRILDLNMDSLEDGFHEGCTFTFSEKLKEKRIKDNKNMQDYAALLGISRQTYSKWESGESIPNIDQFYELCKAFDIKPSFFFYDEDINEIKEQVEEEKPLEISSPKKKKTILLISLCSCIALVIILILCLRPKIKKAFYTPPTEMVFLEEYDSLNDCKKYAKEYCENVRESMSNHSNYNYEEIIMTYVQRKIDNTYIEGLGELETELNSIYIYEVYALKLLKEKPSSFEEKRELSLKKMDVLYNCSCGLINTLNMYKVNGEYQALLEKTYNATQEYELVSLINDYIYCMNLFINNDLSSETIDYAQAIRQLGDDLYKDLMTHITDKDKIRVITDEYDYFVSSLSNVQNNRTYYLNAMLISFKERIFDYCSEYLNLSIDEYKKMAIRRLSYIKTSRASAIEDAEQLERLNSYVEDTIIKINAYNNNEEIKSYLSCMRSTVEMDIDSLLGYQ